MNRALVTLLLGGVVMSSPARAEDLAIVLLNDGLELRRAQAVRAHLAAELTAHTVFELASPESVPAQLEQGELRACAGDARCFAAKVGVGFDDLLVVSIRLLTGQVLMGVRWIESTPDGFVERAQDARTLASPEQIERTLSELLRPLFGPRWDEAGALAVDAHPAATEITVGARVCVSPCRIERLRPGAYAVELRAEGHGPERREVEVRRGELTLLEVRLQPAVSGEPWPPWVWVLGGAIVAGSAAAIIWAAAPSDPSSICLHDPAIGCGR